MVDTGDDRSVNAQPDKRATDRAGEQVAPAAAKRDPPGEGGVLSIFRLRDFRLLVAGEGVSLLGDQFALIALPWLVLQVTGDALVLGLVLAIQGIPRALFMLVGGAVTDRFSPRAVMMAANGVRLVVVSLLATVTLAGTVHVWMLYAFALVFGLADGFFFPAQGAIVPQISGGQRLETANAVVQGLEQVALFVAPVLAGVLIATLSGGGGDLTGIGVALAIDAGTFLVSLLTLYLIRARRFAPASATCGTTRPCVRCSSSSSR
jgi:MFS family permease